MTIRTLAAAVLLFVSALGAAAEHSTPAVLTNDGAVYTVASLPAARLELIRRTGEDRETVLVPSTDDEAIETDAQLAFDSATSTLYVMWHGGDSTYISQRFSDGTWSDPMQIVGSTVKRVGLEVVITRVATTTLVHAAWWSLADAPVAEYALVAFENNEFQSVFISDLDSLAGANTAADYSDENEVTTEVLHPPLAMARAGTSAVEIVFGAARSTRLTRVVLEPKLRADVRIWKPGRKGGKPMPRSGLMSASGDPLKAIVNQGRIILYAPETKFRFVIYENGAWSPERMIQLDEKLTREELVEQLRKTAEGLEIEEPDESVNE